MISAASPSPSPGAGGFTDGTLPAPGWLGFGVLIALMVVTFLLWRSMNRQIKRIDFPEPGSELGPGTPPSDAPTEAPR